MMRTCLQHRLNLCARLGFALLMLLGAAGSAWAHKASDSYLSLQVQGADVSGQWDIALRDLDFAIGLDSDGDGALRWGEVQQRAEAIAAYAGSRLHLSSDGQACPLKVGAMLYDRHSDGGYAVLRLQAHCSAAVSTLQLDYQLLFDVDPQHRGLLKLGYGSQLHSAIFGPELTSQQLLLRQPSLLEQCRRYLLLGVWHIWTGFDHILFLLSLLLPAVLTFGGRFWRPQRTVGAALADVVKIVTAFTVAHSLTLTLATLGLIGLPSRWVESIIAASVVLAALNNIWPVTHGRRWMVAFAFGLIHGFGFASVLADLALPRSALLTALLSFNLGVELGQLAIVALFLPLAFLARRRWVYQRLVLRGGSLAIAVLALLWLTERVLDLRLLPA